MCIKCNTHSFSFFFNYWKSWWFYLCLVGDFTLIFVVEQFVYCYSSGDYWLLGLPKSSCISVEFQSVRSICYLLSSLFFFLSLSPYPLEQKQSWRLKLTILFLSLSLKIDLLNLTSFSFSRTWLLCRKIFFFLSSPESSIHFVSVFKQKKHTPGL